MRRFHLIPRTRASFPVPTTDEVMRREGFVPTSEHAAGDIFVTGYPKSGNTWFQILTSIVMYGVDPKLASFTLMGEIVPDLSARAYYRRHAETMFFKSHALPAPDYRRVVYLLRDGRDVMVSYKHYREVIDRTVYEFETFVAAETSLWPCHWTKHVEAWEQNPFGAEILTIRYEDLVTDPVAQFRRLCAFALVERSDEHLCAAIAATSLESLQRKEQKEGNWDPAFKTDKSFFRRGEVGSHKDEMPPEVLERFLAHAGPTLERLGYV